MRPYTQDDYEYILSIAFEHGGVGYALTLASILGDDNLTLYIVEGGFVGKYIQGSIKHLIATKVDNKFTLSMWKYLKTEWYDNSYTIIASTIIDNPFFRRIMKDYGNGFKVRNLLIKPKE